MNPEVRGIPIRPNDKITNADIMYGYFLPKPERSVVLTCWFVTKIIAMTKNKPVFIIE